jgi:hypothetical protein
MSYAAKVEITTLGVAAQCGPEPLIGGVPEAVQESTQPHRLHAVSISFRPSGARAATRRRAVRPPPVIL